MAIDPSAEYPGQIITGLPGYPLGKATNVAVVGDGTGTPLEARWLSDLFGFEQALLDTAGITPSGDPDEVGASDYMDALDAIYGAPIAALDGRVTTAESDIAALEASRVTGPASATDEAFARFDLTTGKLLQDGVVKATNAGAVTGVTSLAMAGALTGVTTATISGEVARASGKSCEVLHRGGEHFGFGWGERLVVALGNVVPSCNQNASFGHTRLHVPQGATITEVRVFVVPGAARATSGNRMQFALTRAAGITTAGVAGGALDSGFASSPDSGSAAAQQVTLTGSHVHRAGDALYLSVTSGNDAATNPDTLFGCLVFYTENELGGAQ